MRPFVAAALGSVAALACGSVLLWVAVVHEPAFPEAPVPGPSAFPADTVRRGAELAAIGDCVVCHTAPGGRPFAGGRPLATPFGTLFVSNITPDPATGIGTWSAEAFRRAMTQGIGRDGTHLYPALPYEHFTHVTEPDLDAIYAFLMTRHAVTQTTPPNRLTFPFGFRPLLAGWNLLFLDRTPFRPAPDQDEAWNRGAYLVEGLGHCGGCHTPRNIAGGEERSRAYAGGVAEGWNAPALDRSNASPVPWTVDSLAAYLRSGFEHEHGAAAGPMGPVTQDLSTVPDRDVRAIATYVAWLMRDRPVPPPPATLPADRAAQAASVAPEGARLFAGACAGCHEAGAPMMVQGRPALGLANALQHPKPRNTIQAVLQGVEPPVGRAGPFMPPFGDALTDAQIADIAAYLRARFSPGPAWPGLETAVRNARKEGGAP